MKSNFKKILRELSYRVSSGIPDLTNEQHLMKLWDILKEEKWPVEVRVELLKNLQEVDQALLRTKITNPTTKRKIQVRTGLGYKKTNTAAYNVAKSFLKDKGVSDDEIEKQAQKSAEDDVAKEKPKSDFTTKDLKKVDTLQQETYTEEITYSDEDFNKKNKENETPVKISFDDKAFEKVPKKYTKLLERVLNTGITKFNPDIVTKKGKGGYEAYGSALEKKDGKLDVSNTPLDFTYFGIPKQEAGAGATAAQMGEIMTMMFSSLRPKELLGDVDETGKFNSGVAGKIIQHLKELESKGIKTAIDKSWVQAALDNRSAILGHLRSEFGNSYEIVANSWDNKKEVESLGLDYDDKQGSTDMFIKVKDKDGKENLLEVSLKKSFGANLYNGGLVGVVENIESKVDIPSFTNNQAESLDNISTKHQKELQNFFGNSETNPVNTEEGKKAIADVAYGMSTVEKNITKNINDMEEMFSRMFEDVQSNPDLKLDRDYIGNITQAGAKTSAGVTTSRRPVNKSLLMMNEVFAKLNPESNATEDIETHRNLTKNFEKDVIQELNDNSEFKQASLDKCKESLPLQDVLEGKEVMAVGNTIISKKTLKKALGTDDWNKVKESLVVDMEPKPRLVYKGNIEGQERTFSFGDVVVREDGKGYSGGSFKFEIKFNNDLKEFASKASEDTIGRQRNVFDDTIGR